MREVRSYIPLENERAKFAYKKVEETYNNLKKDNDKKEFKSWAQKFPSMITNCGLIQTVSYYEDSKGKKHCEILEAWLKNKGYIGKDKSLIEALLSINDPKEYRFLTLESLKFLTWLKRFSSILYELDRIGSGKNDQSQ